jgi:dTDP-4-amino-4,6-dideoxygalactose transaminase
LGRVGRWTEAVYPARIRAGTLSRVQSQSISAGVGVPFLDLGPSHQPLKHSISREITDLIDTGAFTNGRQVGAFEEAFAAFCGVRNCVGVASGLDALRLGLIAAGLQPGDEVILPANTFVATAEAVTQAGGKPVLVDVREDDYNIDAVRIDAAVTPATRFVLPVHLYGQMADMTSLNEIATARGLTIVEDACQAHGAAREGFGAGTVGVCSAFSFYPGKNLGAFGDAGALTTDDDELAAHVRALREHGQNRKYHHDFEGYTARLDTIQAIVLLHKLPLLTRWNGEREAIAQVYLEELEGIGDLVLPTIVSGSQPSWHLFVVRTGAPHTLGTFLAERGIGTGRHYPQPIHLSAAYASLGHIAGDFPVTEKLAAEVLSLPLFPGMTVHQAGAVVTAIRDFFLR